MCIFRQCIGKHAFLLHALFCIFVCNLFNKAVRKLDNVNLLGDSIDTIKKKAQTLIDASKEVGLELKVRKLSIYCCPVSRMQDKT
jgi:hypothetical protein